MIDAGLLSAMYATTNIINHAPKCLERCRSCYKVIKIQAPSFVIFHCVMLVGDNYVIIIIIEEPNTLA